MRKKEESEGKRTKRRRAKKGKGGEAALLATPLDQASPSRHLGLCLTWPCWRIFWPRNEISTSSKWRYQTWL